MWERIELLSLNKQFGGFTLLSAGCSTGLSACSGQVAVANPQVQILVRHDALWPLTPCKPIERVVRRARVANAARASPWLRFV